MPSQQWVLLDVEKDVATPDLRLSGADFEGSPAVAVVKRTLRGGLRDGVDVVEIDNGAFRFVVLPTRGMGLWKAWGGGMELGWKSPVVGPVNPRNVPLDAPDGLGWLRGFDELLVRCGLESNGPPEFDPQNRLSAPLHGRIANTPAHRLILEWDPDNKLLRLMGQVDESRLFGPKLRLTSVYETAPGRPGLKLRDFVANRSTQPADLELLYHINLGLPSIGPGAEVVVPFKKMVPKTHHAASVQAQWNHYPPPKAGEPEAVFYFQPAADAEGRTQVVLATPSRESAVMVRFPVRELPYFILWKNPLPETDGYVTGLEPAINFPNPKTYESQQGRVLSLPPGASYRSEIEIETISGHQEVLNRMDVTRKLAGDAPPEVYDFPLPGWTVG